jgi:hypothetical protein
VAIINSFKQYIVEETKTVYFTFGRMNPPTVGHGKLIEALSSKAQGNPYKVYLSQSQDKKKNPLEYSEKVKFVRKMFPKYARSIILNKKIKTVFDAAVELYNEGYRNVVMVVGDDRVLEFKALLEKYNGVDARHGFYNFKDIKIVSAGERDPDSEDVTGASATKQRQAAADNDFVQFSHGLPKNFSNKDSKDIFNAVRKGMGLNEEKEFKNHIQLNPISDLREEYISGNIFNPGNMVIISESDEVATILFKGTNYLIVEKQDGTKVRKWLDAVELIEDKGSAKHHLNPNLPLKHALVHAKHIDKDNDGDIDVYDKSTPDELIGTEKNATKKMMKKYSGEKKHIKPGVAFENYLPDEGTDEAPKFAKKITPGQNEEKDTERKKTLPQDQDIKDLKGTQPAGYYKGIKTKSTKLARAAHFRKHSKMDDNNPRAYKPAPGDATVKTEPSKHTKRFKQMFGENK